MSLYDYYHHVYNNRYELDKQKGRHKILCFVGVNGNVIYPVTSAYARATVVVYMPWRKYPKEDDWVPLYESFIKSPICPPTCRMTYEREMSRYYDKMTGSKPKALYVGHSRNPVTPTDMEILQLCGLGEKEMSDKDCLLIRNLPKGKNYEWDKPPKVRHDKGYIHFIPRQLRIFCQT